jgi:hypothetical protein
VGDRGGGGEGYGELLVSVFIVRGSFWKDTQYEPPISLLGKHVVSHVISWCLI